MAIVKALVPMAWADGEFADKEKETLEALLDAFDANEQEKAALREYAKQQRTLDDINLQDLSAGDRRTLVQYAVLLSFVDGNQGAAEKKLLDDLVTRLKIPAEEAGPLLEVATQRAKKFLKML